MGINKLLGENKFLSALAGAAVLPFSVIRVIKRLFVQQGTCTVALCFHKLGDSVFTLPALRALSDNLKEDFYIFCFEETKPIYEFYFNKDFIIGFSHPDIHLNNRFAGTKIRKKLASLNPLHIYDFTGSVTSASLLLTSAAKEVTGIHEPYYRSLYTLPVPIRKEPHILDIYLDVIRKAFPGHDYENYKEFPVKSNPEGYILIHPFAGWAAKEWEMEKFIKAAKVLSVNYNIAFVAESGLMKSEDIAELDKSGIVTFETKTITELINVIKKSSLMFSNDSGPAYIASALGIPTFTIFGPTNPGFHIPYGNGHRYIQKKIKCSPLTEKYCFTDGGRNGCPSFECMKQLTVDDILNSISPFIKELGINSKNAVR